MNSLQDQIARNRRLGNRSVLATMIKKEGSSYRSPGAKIIISEDGTAIGLISGGCLENDVIASANSVFLTGRCKLVSFDTRSQDDIVFGSGVGCKGKILVFIELLPDLNAGSRYFTDSHLMQILGSCVVCASTEKFASLVGKRFLLDEIDFLMDGPLRDEIKHWGQSCVAANTSATKSFIYKNDSIEIFVDILHPTPEIHIIGGGADAIPVHDFAAALDWQVHIYDHRPAFARDDRFPRAKSVNLARPEAFEKQFHPASHKFIVLMSHNYLIDQDYLRFLLALDLPFIGLLGPKSRGDQMLKELSSEGFQLSPEILRKFHNPIGLNIGGDRPEAIALAICAQIQAIIAGKKPVHAEAHRSPWIDHQNSLTGAEALGVQ